MSVAAKHREFLAGQLAALHLGEQVIAVFDDTHGGQYRIVGELRQTGSQGLLVGPQMIRTGAGIVASGLRTIGLCTPGQVPPVGFRERVAQALRQHEQLEVGARLGGEEAVRYAEHVAGLLAERGIVGDAALVVERVRKVFNDMWASPDWDGQVSIGFASTFGQGVDMVLADCAPTSNDYLAAISSWIDNSPRYQEAPRELADTWRVVKLMEELGEAVGAVMGWMGENPRKGTTHSLVELEHELLDVCAAAMGALMHFHDNDPAADVLGYLIEHIRTRAVRGIPHGLVMPAARPELLGFV